MACRLSIRPGGGGEGDDLIIRLPKSPLLSSSNLIFHMVLAGEVFRLSKKDSRTRERGEGSCSNGYVSRHGVYIHVCVGALPAVGGGVCIYPF